MNVETIRCSNEPTENIENNKVESDKIKKRIIETVNKIENIRILNLVCAFAESGYEEENAGA